MPVPPSVIVTTAITTLTGLLVTALYRKLAGYIDHSGEWRASVDRRMKEQDTTIKVVLTMQCSQVRSDLVHKAHRYIDDIGRASTEEKDAFWAEFEDYQRICEANGITNHFIDALANQVMALPTRD